MRVLEKTKFSIQSENIFLPTYFSSICKTYVKGEKAEEMVMQCIKI